MQAVGGSSMYVHLVENAMKGNGCAVVDFPQNYWINPTSGAEKTITQHEASKLA
jgi:hypothetical protein